jgi:hypothetical protein
VIEEDLPYWYLSLSQFFFEAVNAAWVIHVRSRWLTPSDIEGRVKLELSAPMPTMR